VSIRKFDKRFITWSEIFQINQSFTIVDPKKRYLTIIKNWCLYYYRLIMNKPITWESKLKEYKRVEQDLSQVDPTKYYQFKNKTKK
jgi:hypothetical protein